MTLWKEDKAQNPKIPLTCLKKIVDYAYYLSISYYSSVSLSYSEFHAWKAEREYDLYVYSLRPALKKLKKNQAVIVHKTSFFTWRKVLLI